MSRLQRFKRQVVARVEYMLNRTGMVGAAFFLHPRVDGDHPERQLLYYAVSDYEIAYSLSAEELHERLLAAAKSEQALFTAFVRMSWLFRACDALGNVIGWRTITMPYDQKNQPGEVLKKFQAEHSSIMATRCICISFEYVMPFTHPVTHEVIETAGGTFLTLDLLHDEIKGYHISSYTEFGTEHGEGSMNDGISRRLVAKRLYEEVSTKPFNKQISVKDALQIIPGPYAVENP